MKQFSNKTIKWLNSLILNIPIANEDCLSLNQTKIIVLKYPYGRLPQGKWNNLRLKQDNGLVERSNLLPNLGKRAYIYAIPQFQQNIEKIEPLVLMRRMLDVRKV